MISGIETTVNTAVRAVHKIEIMTLVFSGFSKLSSLLKSFIKKALDLSKQGYLRD
jgi:hypothetical protein